MLLARILCAIGLILGLFTIICPMKIFRIENTIRRFMINEFEGSNFNIFIYRVGGIFEILIFTLLLTQTLTI